MGGGGGNAETGAGGEADAFGQRHRQASRQSHEARRRAEGPLPLAVIDPDPLPDPRGGDPLADGGDDSGTIAVGNDAGKGDGRPRTGA